MQRNADESGKGKASKLGESHVQDRRRPNSRRSTWGAFAGLRDGEFLMRRATVTAGLAGKDGRLGEGLRQRATGLYTE